MSRRLLALGFCLLPVVVFGSPNRGQAPPSVPQPGQNGGSTSLPLTSAVFSVSFSPQEGHRGDTVTVALAGDDKVSSIASASVVLAGVPPGQADEPIGLIPVPAASKTTANFTFTVPTKLALGDYQVKVNADKSGEVAAPKLFHLAMAAPPKITSVYPTVTYPKASTFDLTVFGENFSPVPSDNVLQFTGSAMLGVCPEGQTSECVKVQPSSDGRKLVFGAIPFRYAGRQKVVIWVGNKATSEEVQITLSKVAESLPASIAVFAGVGLLVLVLIIVGYGWRKRRGSASSGPSLLTSFFYDPQTSSYSLSTFQFYVWTIAAVVGYVYLTTAKSLVQGTFEFANIPEGLPGILGISAGTTILAVGMSSDKTKGAGTPKPSISDFLTTGGLVVPERVQFFVWTLVGVVSFLFLVFSISPSQINDLPKVPNGFLYLMGISATGYIGGKFARPSGPVITSLTKTPAANVATADYVIVGRNFDSNVKVTVGTNPPIIAPNLNLADPEDAANYFRKISFNTDDAKPGTIVTVSNGDGQKAQQPLP